MTVLMLALLSGASAQTQPATDVNAQLFQPAIDGSYFRVSDATSTAKGTWIWRTTLGYVHKPLQYTTWDDRDVLVVGGVTQLDLGFGVRLGPVRLGADLPVLVHGGGDFGDLRAGIGQPYVDGKVLLVADPESAWGAAIVGRALIPNGAGAAPGLGGDASGVLELVGERQVTSAWRITATAGAWLQGAREIEGTEWGNRLTFGLGNRVSLGSGPTLLAELTAQPVLSAMNDASAWPSEALLGAEIPMGKEDPSYALAPAFSVGLVDAAGTPVYRLLVQARRLPVRVVDLDGDGLVDAEDACPREPEDVDAYEDADGCPEPTQVTVRILDTDGMKVEGATWTQGEQSGADGATVALAAGEYAFQVGDVTVSTAVPSGAPMEVTLVVPAPRGKLLVKVVDKDGKDVDGSKWSAQGQVNVSELPGNQSAEVRPGTYALRAEAPGFRPASGEVEVALVGEATLTLTMIPSKIEVTKTQIDLKDSVYFDTAKAIIQARSFDLLDEIAQTLKDHPELLEIRIEGHTDDRGNDASNKDLSQRRAEAVRTFLMERGVEGERLTAVGFGEERPKVPGTSAEAREQNRRVDFFVARRKE